MIRIPDGLKYLLPSDDYLLRAFSGSPIGLSTTATPDLDFALENIGDGDPSNPFKTPDTTINIDIDLGQALPVGVVAFIHSNIKPGLSGVLATGGPSPGGGTFTSDDVEIPDYQEDGHPTNAQIEFVEQTYRYWRISVTSANAVGLSFGEIVIGPAYRVLDADFQLGATDEEEHPTVENESEYGGVTAIDEQLIRRRFLRGTIRLQQSGDTEPIVRWRRASRGRGRPFLIDPRLPIAEPWYVRWVDPRASRSRLFQFNDYEDFARDYPIAFEEIPRGLPPEPDGNV